MNAIADSKVTDLSTTATHYIHNTTTTLNYNELWRTYVLI